jgi:zinc transport system permease protein
MIAVIAPLIGNFLVIRRLSLIADTLAHIALAGIGLGLLLGAQPLLVTVVVTTAAALMIEWLRSRRQLPAEAVLAMFLPGGLALAVVLISLANGFNANLFSYLFGSITTVRPEELWLILGLGAAVLVAVAALYRPLLYASFDEDSARVDGVRVGLVNSVLIVLTAVTVTLAMRVVGILLIGALMVIPAVTAMQLARSFRQSLVLSIIIAVISVLAGLFGAYYLNLPAGASIVLVSLGIFGLSAARKL